MLVFSGRFHKLGKVHISLNSIMELLSILLSMLSLACVKYIFQIFFQQSATHSFYIVTMLFHWLMLYVYIILCVGNVDIVGM